jgi:hypothetical protein
MPPSPCPELPVKPVVKAAASPDLLDPRVPLELPESLADLALPDLQVPLVAVVWLPAHRRPLLPATPALLDLQDPLDLQDLQERLDPMEHQDLLPARSPMDLQDPRDLLDLLANLALTENTVLTAPLQRDLASPAQWDLPAIPDLLVPLDLPDPTDKMPLVTVLDPRDPREPQDLTVLMDSLENLDQLASLATLETAVFAPSTALLMVACSSRTASRE